MRLEIDDRADSAASETGFAAMVQAATGIGYEPGEFIAELVNRCGFKDHIHAWASPEKKIPNGWARKIILTCAEIMIRERGAQPALSMTLAA